MTNPNEPDAGPMPDTGPVQTDAGPEEDGGVFPDPSFETCTPEGMGSTIGEACTADGACDDGCYCNGVERCESGQCVAGDDPCPDEVDCTADVCLEEANRCFNEPQHGVCDNGNACDGIEICHPLNGCTAGAPLYCNDESSCTLDSCDPTMGCVFQARDLDGDGFNDGRCGGDDCDDDPRFGTAIFPGATELCTNRRDDDCDGMRDYLDLDCVPTNDTCESAVVITGPGTYSGATRGLSSDYTLGCRSGTGPDAVFRFTLTEMQDVTLTVAGGGSGAGIALRPWAQCATGPDDKCNDGLPPSFLRRSLPAGEYAVIVQSNDGGAAFDLNVRFGPPTEIPPIDVCNADTEDLCGGTACGPMSMSLSGMFADTEDNYVLSCAWGENGDAVYKFTLDHPMDVTVRGAAGWTTYVALTSDCSSAGAERRCESGNPAEVIQRELQAGTYYIMVESDSSTASIFSLDVTFAEPGPRNTGDACSAAIDISEPTLGAGGSGAVHYSAISFDTGTSCGGRRSSWGDRDATFRFTLPEMRDVTITTDSGVDWTTYYVSLQPTCGDISSDLRCWSGSRVMNQSWRSLPAGDYFVTVASSFAETIRVNLETRPPTTPPPNDRCAGAEPLTSGVAVAGTTLAYEDDMAGGSCTSGSLSDAFYTFTLGTRSNVLLSVRDADDGTPTDFSLTLRRDTCGTGPEAACTTASTGSPPSSTINAILDPGTYYLQVETASTAGSDFTLLPVFFPAP